MAKKKKKCPTCLGGGEYCCEDWKWAASGNIVCGPFTYDKEGFGVRMDGLNLVFNYCPFCGDEK